MKTQNVCEECGLIFSRLEIATNAEAKRHILKRDKDFIIYTKDLPKDVKKWKLVLLSIFTGLVGGHYFYVGKFWKGAYMCIMFVWLFVSTYFNSQILEANASMYAYFPVGVYAIVWLVSIVLVISNKFKVPIMVEEPKLEEIEKIREDFNKFGQEINKTVEENNERKVGKISSSNVKSSKKGKKKK